MKDSLIFQIMIYLGAAVLMVPLAKKIGLGPVLGYLLGGILIGPDLLNLIGHRGEMMLHFGEFGVVMMLFVIGLELNPAKLWALRKSIFGMGVAQVLISAALLMGLGLLIHLDWKQALALGLTLSMSSTAIVLQIFQEKKLIDQPAGQQGFSVLLFQDISVIPILAIFPLLATQPEQATANSQHLLSNLPYWMQTSIVLLSVAVIILAGKYLMPFLFRIVARTGLREMFTASVLLIVVSVGVLMTLVGLSPALGTFLAGVILANSEFRHELESDIDPFKGLFLGLFFLAVGASIDFHLIAAEPLQIFGLVFSIMLVKMIVLFVLGRSFRMPVAQNSIFSFALCQVGEFAFVLLSFSLQEKIFSPEFIQIMFAVVAISMALTPLLMLLYFKLIQPRLVMKSTPTQQKESDVTSSDNAVIIAGYGHLGNTIGRLLRANRVEATVLDADADLVNRLRRMGFSVFYGDATRRDLLEIAGAKNARVMVIAVPDPDTRLKMVEIVKRHFPHLKLLVRATNRYDAYDLLKIGVEKVYRESFDTSVRMGVDALGFLDHDPVQTDEIAKIFFEKDEDALLTLGAIRNDDEYVQAVKKYSGELEELLKSKIITK